MLLMSKINIKITHKYPYILRDLIKYTICIYKIKPYLKEII